ncbi:MAG: phage tail tape measure protein [bacterium]|nr:phage tail tape measure protein [bacterium]
MDKNKESLKAEFVLDVSTLNKQLDAASRQLTSAMKRATDNMAKVMAGNTAAWSGAGTKIGATMGTSIAHSVTRALAGLGGSITRTVGRIASTPIRMVTSPIGMITGGLSAAGAVAGFGKVINAGRDLQSEQVQIQKTTNLSDAAIAHLTQSLIAFSNATGSSRSAMMGLAADAGRLGVRSTEDLEKFATTFIKAATATNVGPDMAEEVLRVMNSIGEPVSRIDRVMSAVNELGNNLATNERRILDFMGTMPGMNTILGLSTSQLLGFAGAASATANEAGLVGTAMNGVSIAMLKGIAEGGKALAIFAETAGMSNTEWKELVSRDKNEALLRFIEGIKRTRDSGGDLISIFADMGGEGARLVRVMMSLSQITDSLRTSQARAAAELQQNTSLTDEFGRRLQTVEQQQKRVTQALHNFFATLNDNKMNTKVFETLADVVQKMINEHQVQMAQRLREIIEKIAEAVVGLPYEFQKMRVIWNAMMTDPEYLTGIVKALGLALGDALSAAWTTFLGLIVATIDLIVKPITDAVLQALAASVAGFPVLGEMAVGRAAKGYSSAQLMRASGMTDTTRRGTPALPSVKEAEAQGGMQNAFWKGAYDYAKEKTKGQVFDLQPVMDSFMSVMTPEMFQRYVVPNMDAKAQEQLMLGIAKLREDPQVREERSNEVFKQAATRTGDALKQLNVALDGAADRVRQAGVHLADAIAGKGTKSEKELAAIEAQKKVQQQGITKKLHDAITSTAPLKEQFDALFKKGNFTDAMRPLRTAMEKPVKAKYKPEDWVGMDEKDRQKAVNNYYKDPRRTLGRDASEMIGLGGGAQLYRRDLVQNRMRQALQYEDRNYTDKRGQMLNRYVFRQGAAEKFSVGSAGEGERPINIKIAPEMSEVIFKENGEMRATMKWRHQIETATTAAALTGSA